MTADSLLITDTDKKIFKIKAGVYKGGLYAFAGEEPSGFACFYYLEDKTIAKPKLKDFIAFIVTPEKEVLLIDKRLIPIPAKKHDAIGTGDKLAIAIMNAGHSAYDAVIEVCKNYVNCGGKIQRVKV